MLRIPPARRGGRPPFGPPTIWRGNALFDCFQGRFRGLRHRSGADVTVITLFCTADGRPLGFSQGFSLNRRGNETTVDDETNFIVDEGFDLGEDAPVAQYDVLNSTELRQVLGAAFEELADEVENGSGRNLLRP
ncbi:unnamed protein product [Vitrella brassicaformis CCMP3155]|uniref:Uncharacterized protein n=1 Tax=Vitrella brassicaformis (strain CCMP3155) TaxID=1169540 RepID=A0A0G4EUX6_VITBC|nr:unnamed protein product [Vitrella brassicaformis CCMP3155]|eukprot:CEM02054.1 unnamed protein product [Vitrella brassicaformis CCMP3155]